ncbi:flagellar export chaperone FliS [Salsuginibacillus kocurii]|uniref:flagellar export chaperone FliS n=1 Tax=Salsuginibacillus kocurii TaxID=427078 RepID=UPI000365B840|nr:flagellar export chaperone FliS [Salsuginibacillus kocurii]
MSFISEELLYQKSAEELTALLYEACEDNLEEAKAAIYAKEFMTANEKLQKANDILYRLGSGLSYDAGIIADQLDSLYNYMADRIIEANYKKEVTAVEEALKVLRPIAESWRQAMAKKEDKQLKPLKHKTNAYEQHVMFD